VSLMVTMSSPSPTSWHSFALPFPSASTSSSRGGRRWVGDELHNVILQHATYVSTTTLGKSVLGGLGHGY
jgi:hypothetical protein